MTCSLIEIALLVVIGFATGAVVGTIVLLRGWTKALHRGHGT